ncbi:MAG: hypothetical protein ACI9TH_002256 [Kiritimatiellia bacterium]|jgi:hypothetical protein
MHRATPTTTDRRTLLKTAACGFGHLALAGLAQPAAASGIPNLHPKGTHFAPRAKRVIFIFMQGGPSQVDTFSYKPQLEADSGTEKTFYNARSREISKHTLQKSLWEFKQHGQSGAYVSSIFPNIAQHVDKLCFIHSMHTEGVAHGPATLFMHTGATNLIRPSMGAWVSYGLGTENNNLPSFVTLNPPWTKGGPRNYGNGFLPTVFQGTVIGRAGQPADKATIKNIVNHQQPKDQEAQLAFLQSLNQEQAHGREDDYELQATIESYELAYRMQMHAPALTELDGESDATKALYGIDEKHTNDFGRQCLQARRMAEAGVRYIQVNYSDNGATPRWDQHSNMPKHAEHARATDKPVAGLLADLHQRGLLEDTLVWWGGEFGRTPFTQNKDGRDHNPRGFTVFLAGGGVKPGLSYGQTDEYGYEAVEDKVHMHDLHATVLHLLGLDHERLTYQYAGREFRLTDVYGNVVHDILA